MSAAVDVISEAGPYILGIGGLVFGYFGGLKPAREARQQSRIEALYQDMLKHNAAEERAILPRFEFFANTMPVDVWPTLQEADSLQARVDLFASPSVRATWSETVRSQDRWHRLIGNESEQLSNGAFAMGVLEEMENAKHELTLIMRTELGVRNQRGKRFSKLPWLPAR